MIFKYEYKFQWIPPATDNVHVYIYTKGKKNQNIFRYTKCKTFWKKQDNFRCVFICKKHDTLLYAIFMKFSKLTFIHKKHDTLRYVKFLYTKIRTLRIKQDNFRYVFIFIYSFIYLYNSLINLYSFIGVFFSMEDRCNLYPLPCRSGAIISCQPAFREMFCGGVLLYVSYWVAERGWWI